MHARTLYAAKCYWPGVTESQLEQATVRAAAEARTASRAGAAIAYLGAIVFPDDELVLCLFDAGSRAAVRRRTVQRPVSRDESESGSAARSVATQRMPLPYHVEKEHISADSTLRTAASEAELTAIHAERSPPVPSRS
jgi:hypothetical protein